MFETIKLEIGQRKPQTRIFIDGQEVTKELRLMDYSLEFNEHGATILNLKIYPKSLVVELSDPRVVVNPVDPTGRRQERQACAEALDREGFTEAANVLRTLP